MLSYTPQQSANAGLIVIRCNYPDLRTSILAQAIAERLRMECRVLPLNEHKLDNEAICLIDCQNQNVAQLRQWLQQQAKLKESPLCALFNLPLGSRYESLIEWPNVKGIFHSPLCEDKLMRGLPRLISGEFWMPRQLLNRFLEENRKPPHANRRLPHLTRREKQILQLICQSASNATIAKDLHVSEHTVKSHLYNLYKKIGVKSRLQASNWAHETLALEQL